MVKQTRKRKGDSTEEEKVEITEVAHLATVNKRRKADESMKKQSNLEENELKGSRKSSRVKSIVKKVSESDEKQNKKSDEGKSATSAKRATFEEENNVVDMEINDGGEFLSEEDGDESDSDSDDETDKEQENESGADDQESEQKQNKSSAESSEAESNDSDYEGRSESDRELRSRSITKSPKGRGRSRSREKSVKRKHRRRRASSSSSRRRRARKERDRQERAEMAAKIDSLSNSILALQDVMTKKGVFEEGKQNAREKEKGSRKACESNSETTIYKSALDQVEIHSVNVDDEITFHVKQNTRESTSSEDEIINTSDETVNIDCHKFIVDCQKEAACSRRESAEHSGCGSRVDRVTERTRGGQMVYESERERHPLNPTSGKAILFDRHEGEVNTNMLTESECDREYMVVGGHLDEHLQNKIINFEYVDFARLIPKDRVTKVEDHRLELVCKGGATFFAPISDRELSGINNFTKWEQAFRIYSNIITKAYPSKATERIQYNHVIYTASLTFVWENVYQYDKEFRLHISKFPHQKWSVILQQAWSMCLKDRLKSFKSGKNQANEGKVVKIKEPCKRYNRGKCTFGPNCKYEHRCSIERCSKFGHGVHICRLRNKDRDYQNRKDKDEASTSAGACK